MLPILRAFKTTSGKPSLQAKVKSARSCAQPAVDLMARLYCSSDPISTLLYAFLQTQFNLRGYLSCNRYFFGRIQAVDLLPFCDAGALLRLSYSKGELLYPSYEQMEQFIRAILENAALFKSCSCFGASIAGLPEVLADALPQMTQLQVLSLPRCGLTSFSFLSRLYNLTTLNVAGNSFASFTGLTQAAEQGGLKALQALNLRATGLCHAAFLLHLYQLRTFDASENPGLEMAPILLVAPRLERLLLQKTPPLEFYQLQALLAAGVKGVVDADWRALRMLGRVPRTLGLRIDCATYGVGCVPREYVTTQRCKYYVFQRFHGRPCDAIRASEVACLLYCLEHCQGREVAKAALSGQIQALPQLAERQKCSQ